MKTTTNAFFLLMTLCFFSVSKAQDCNHLAFKKGASYEMETFDNKDKKTGTVKNTVKEVTESGAKKEATIQAESYDKKNEKQGEGTLKIICEGSKMWIDMSGFSKNNPMANNPDMEIKMEGNLVEFPSKMSVGQTFPDATMTMKMVDKKSGQEFASTKMTMINRKVEGKETITTAAGTFECYKISCEIKIATSMSMGMNLPATTLKSINYISTDLGLTVKGQNYNQKGDLTSYEVLTKYTK